MTDERYTFEQARLRLEEIASQARKKDTTLEKSLDLLEEGARLALICTELVDHTDFSDTVEVPVDVASEDAPDTDPVGDEATASEPDDDAATGEEADGAEPDASEDDGPSVQ